MRVFFQTLFLSGALCLSVVSLDTITGVRTAMAIEKVKYEVVEKDGKYELRQYADHIVAQTIVEGSFHDVGNDGFRILAGYIFGKNRRREKIEMTAPVSQEAPSEKIEMTAPVNQQAEGDRWRITFVMPSRYTMETLPEPIDERVQLRKVSGQLTAALKYSGSWSHKRYERKKAQLESIIAAQGLVPVGKPTFARYNPPFMPWFLRRNEVLIPVQRVSD
jgi:hypothetical protein